MTKPPALSLFVLRANDPAALARMYELLGCEFQREQHGNGPEHFSTVLGGVVLEIYPTSQAQPATKGLRLGFRVAHLDDTLFALQQQGATLTSAAQDSQWGRRAVLVDLEGHTLELMESPTAPLNEYVLSAVTAEWLPGHVTAPAYTNGQHWNGWAMPLFTLAAAKQLLQHMPELHYDEPTDAFVVDPHDDNEETIERYGAEYLTVAGERVKVYAIGAGSWCWELQS